VRTNWGPDESLRAVMPCRPRVSATHAVVAIGAAVWRASACSVTAVSTAMCRLVGWAGASTSRIGLKPPCCGQNVRGSRIERPQLCDDLGVG